MEFLTTLRQDWGSLYKSDRLLMAAALFLPILFFTFFLAPTPVLRNIFYLSLPFSLALLYRDRVHVKSMIRDNLYFWGIITGFLAYMSLSVFWSETTETGRYFEKGKLGLFILTALVSTAYIAHRFNRLSSYLLSAFVASANISGAISTSLTLEKFITNGHLSRLRGLGRAENPVQAGLLFALALLAILFGRFAHPLTLFQRASMALIPLTTLLLTQSRGPLLALAVTTCVILMMRVKRKLMVFSVGLSLILTGSLGAYITLKDTTFINRASTGRTEIWSTAFHQVAEAPVFGHGLASKTIYSFNNGQIVEQVGHAHNLYLSTLIQGGLIGLSGLLAILLLCLHRSLILHKQLPTPSPTSPAPDLEWLLSWICMGALLGMVDFGGYVINLSTEWLVFWWPLALLLSLPRAPKAT